MRFAPESPTWRVHREGVLLLGGPRALLMQLAHPLVAAGVSQHSAFPDDAWRRLRRTLDAMLGIIYGERAEGEDIARALRAVHARVHGTLDQGAGRFPVGTAYSALDPELGLWVWGTLVDSTLAAYDAFVSPLPADERETYYHEATEVAALLDLPAKLVPADLGGFRAYISSMLASDVLEPTCEARRLADAVMHPPIPLLPRSISGLIGPVTLGLLPAELRRRYDLPWGALHEAAWLASRTVIRASLPFLPEFLRAMPQARRAERSLR